MATLQQIRAQHPEYDDLSDKKLSDALYAKHYSDMPRSDFNAKIGFNPDILDDVGDAVVSAGKNVVKAVKDDYAAKTKWSERVRSNAPPSLMDGLKEGANSIGRAAGIVGSAVAVPLSPIAGVQQNVVTRPIGKRLTEAFPESTFPGSTQSNNEKIVNTAMMGLGFKAPRAALPALPPPPRPANVLADNIAMFDRAGVRPNVAATGNSRAAAGTANAVAENLIAGGRTRSQLAGQAQDAATATQNRAADFGTPANDRASAGNNVQSGIQGFKEKFSERAGKLYDRAFTPIEAAEARRIAGEDAAHANRTQVVDAAYAQQVAQAEANYQRAVQASQAAADARNAVRVGGPEVMPEPVARPVIPAKPTVTPPRQAVVAKETTVALKDMASRVNAENLKAMITDGRYERLNNALKSDGANLRFNDMRALRTWVRETKRSPELSQGIGQANLNRLESALTQDIYDNASRLAGPKGLRSLQQADQFYRLGTQRMDGALQRFVGRGASEPLAGEATYDRVLSAAGEKGGADIERLKALRNSLPSDQWGDLSSTIISHMGKPTAGAAAAGDFSVSSWSTRYNGISPAGKDVLFGKGPLRSELENLAKVMDRLKMVERGANSSNSAVSAQNLGSIGGVGAGAMALAGGNPAVLGTVGVGLGGMAGVGEFMTNPAAVRWLARMGEAQISGPQQLRVVITQIENAARSNRALLPLAQQARLALEGPRVPLAIPAAAQDKSEQQR